SDEPAVARIRIRSAPGELGVRATRKRESAWAEGEVTFLCCLLRCPDSHAGRPPRDTTCILESHEHAMIRGIERHYTHRTNKDPERQFTAAPRTEETGLGDVFHRHYGYRLLTELVRREVWAVNHKRVRRLIQTNNLLCLLRPLPCPRR